MKLVARLSTKAPCSEQQIHPDCNSTTDESTATQKNDMKLTMTIIPSTPSLLSEDLPIAL